MTMARRRRSTSILGFVSPALAILVLVGIGLFTSIPGAVATNRTETLASVLADAAIAAAAGALLLLAVTCRVVGTEEGLRVTNLFRETTMDTTRIAGVEVRRGLVIVTTDGRNVKSSAYGASLIGDVFGYRRAQGAQERCRTWLAALATPDGPPHDGVVATLRRAVWVLPVVLFACYVAEVFVTRALT
jgi:hypothetical protein